MKSFLNIHWKDGSEALILWLPDVKSGVISKDPDAGERLEEGGQGDDRE